MQLPSQLKIRALTCDHILCPQMRYYVPFIGNLLDYRYCFCEHPVIAYTMGSHKRPLYEPTIIFLLNTNTVLF